MAIAFDNSNKSWDNVSTLTYSLTVGTGDNRYLIVVCDTFNNRTITGVTYAGVAMTQLKAELGNLSHGYIFGLANPASGTNNVVVSQDGTTHVGSIASSYTGVDPNEPGVTAADQALNSSSLSVSSTTTVANSWLVDLEQADDTTSTTISSNSPQNQRQQINNVSILALSDKPTTTVGSYSMGFTTNNPKNLIIASVELKPATASASRQRTLVGVGL